jgi:rubrerythrin
MAKLSLAEFFAHSVELESEARDRYEELADSMSTHHNREVAAFFTRMSDEATHHLQEVAEMSEGMELPHLKAWDFQWPEEEPPETASYESVHYRMSLRQAMTLALRNERAAEAFYRQCAHMAQDGETNRVATHFADEERSHAESLERLMSELPENGEFLFEEDDEPHIPE